MTEEYTGEECRKAQEVKDADITRRLDQGEDRMGRIEISLAQSLKKIEALAVAIAENTAATHLIAKNTEPMVRLVTDLTAGTNLMCRVAIGLRFLLIDVIKPYWQPALIVFCTIWMVTHDALPSWMLEVLKALHG